jgi:hypothetical protein
MKGKLVRLMGETSDRVEAALAAHLDYLEMGGREPDTSHLTATELEELRELIDALELTDGIAFGRGLREERRQDSAPPAGARAAAAPSEESDKLLAQLRDNLAPAVRIEPDTSALVSQIGGIDIVAGWIVGTFGGRVRVWLLDVDEAQTIERNNDCLPDLNRAFRLFPDTAAVALVARDLSCLLVQPEDCAPQISAPSGSFVGRRYRRAIQPAADAVAAYVDELIPYWDPVPALDPGSGLRIDASAVGREFVKAAIERQRGVGERARKGNPKKDALLALGKKEMSTLSSLTDGLFDGTVTPADVAERIERLAKET